MFICLHIDINFRFSRFMALTRWNISLIINIAYLILVMWSMTVTNQHLIAPFSYDNPNLSTRMIRFLSYLEPHKDGKDKLFLLAHMESFSHTYEWYWLLQFEYPLLIFNNVEFIVEMGFDNERINSSLFISSITDKLVPSVRLARLADDAIFLRHWTYPDTG